MKMKELPKKFKFLVADQDETFRLYVDRKEIGKKVLASLKTKLSPISNAEGAPKGFYLSSRNKEIGLLSQLYGANALFTITNRYGVAFSEEETAQIKDCIRYVTDFLEDNDNCYDASPILDEEVNAELFLDKGNRYIGAMTWALSLFTSARVAQRKEMITFTEEETAKIFKHTRAIIKFFVDNVVGTEDRPLGWGYTNGCLEPSLFFTYSVVEAFADFDDNVLNDEGALGSDEELIAYIDAVKGGDELTADETLTSRYKSLCFKIGDRAWALFKDVLKTDFFSDNFSETFKVISREEILNSSRSSVLFNTLYVIFILFYSYTNSRNKEESEDIVTAMTLGLQLIQNFYDELKTVGKESIVDRHIIAFDQPHDTIKDFGKLLNEETIQASPFLPMLVKANNLIAYYILEFPQQQMRDLFDMMLEAQMDGERDWLWDKRKYDLLSTERYLESIADFFDYYDKFERNYADKATTDAKRRKEIREELTQSISKAQEKKLEKKHLADLEELRRNMAEEFPIEKSINERIDSKIEARAMSMLTDTVDKIIEYNKAPQKQKAAIEETFTPAQKKLKAGMETMLASYLAGDIRVTAMSAGEMPEAVLDEAVKNDIALFMKSYVEFIAHNNANLPDDKKLSLADVFKIITNKNN